MKDIKSIELVLENCEVIEIKRQHIGIFNMSNVHRSIRGNASNRIHDYINAEETFIQICSKANVVDAYSSTWSDNETVPFKRLTEHRDIVALRLHYNDDTEEYIYVKWGGDSDYTNANETVKINEHTGDLYIAVSEVRTIDSYFGYRLTEERNRFWKSDEI